MWRQPRSIHDELLGGLGSRVPGHAPLDIDVVAPTGGTALVVGEAKFQQQPVGYDVRKQLEDEAPLIDWQSGSDDDPTYEYALFARNGSAPSVEVAADRRDDLRVVSVDDGVDLITE